MLIWGHQAGIREELPSVLVCVSAGARPAAVISWYNGSLPLLNRDTHPVRHMAILQADGTYITRSRIVLTPTRFDHNRTIQCRARNEVLDHLKQEPQKDNFTLHVNYSPVVSMISRTVVVNESENFQLSCTFEGNPRNLVRVVWFHNDTPIDMDSERYEMITSDMINLLVRQARKNDSGLYFCRLSNVIGQGQPDKSTSVEVYTRPTVRIRMDPLSPVREGEQVNVTLFCDIEQGNPRILTRVRWFMDHILLNELAQCDLEGKSEDNLCDVDPSKLILQSVNRIPGPR